MTTAIQLSGIRPKRLAWLSRSNSRARNIPARYKKQIANIRKSENEASNLSERELLSKVNALRERVSEKGIHAKTQMAFAGIVAEAVFRTHGFRLFDVQIAAIAAGADGNVVEMQTGEGKTVVTGAIAAVKTLTAPSVHVGTTNTYLAARDLEDLEPTFELLGIQCGLLPEESNESASRRVYRKQIVYGPGYQFGFDYLRDQMHLRNNRESRLGVSVLNRIRGNNPSENLIQNANHYTALIDEADSVMIDEAMTPLIISLPSNRIEDPTPYQVAKKVVSSFEEGVDYKLNRPKKKIDVLDKANQKAHEFVAAHKNLQLVRPWRIYIQNAIRAESLFQKNVDYVVVDEKVQIVDQFTGRILPDRTWQDGLHQAVEAKENVEIQPGRDSTAQVTRQRYLQMYDQLAGLTGTAVSVSDEFRKVYGCPVIAIPTNKPSRRQIVRTRFFADLDAKLSAIADDVVSRHQTGQPILVGTKTIQESIQVNEALRARGLCPTLLNGVQDEEEASIVARAGLAGAITIATNMAGRGTDIKPNEDALAAGGLHVIGVSPNSSARIDRQLVGRAARQGQPGSGQFFAAATDAIFVDNDSPLPKQILRRTKSNGESGDFSRDIQNLQRVLEARGFQRRQDMILRDRWMDMVREAIEKD